MDDLRPWLAAVSEIFPVFWFTFLWAGYGFLILKYVGPYPALIPIWFVPYPVYLFVNERKRI